MKKSRSRLVRTALAGAAALCAVTAGTALPASAPATQTAPSPGATPAPATGPTAGLTAGHAFGHTSGLTGRLPGGLTGETTDYYFHIGRDQALRPQHQYALNKMQVRRAWWRHNAYGQGVTVAVVDSGIGETRELAGRRTKAVDYVTGRHRAHLDAAHHGTAVASVIAARNDGRGISGVAPRARLVSARVFDAWTGHAKTIIAGINWAIDQKVDIINLSLIEEPYPALRQAINRAHRKGIVVVAGSGNDGWRGARKRYPAALPGVISVGGTNRANKVPAFANAGLWVDVVAPADRILAADPGDTLSYYTGTSMSTPHVTGVVALMLSVNPRLTPAQVDWVLKKSATDLGAKGRDRLYGFGLVNADRAVAFARKMR